MHPIHNKGALLFEQVIFINTDSGLKYRLIQQLLTCREVDFSISIINNISFSYLYFTFSAAERTLGLQKKACVFHFVIFVKYHCVSMVNHLRAGEITR